VQIPRPDSIILRTTAAALFAAGGLCLALISLAGIESWWYFPCFCALPILSIVWALKPRVAAGLSVGPLIAVAAWIRFTYEAGPWFWLTLSGLVAACLLVLIATRNLRVIRVPLLLSLAFLAGAFITDRLFTGQVSVKTFQMSVALNGNAPWGTVGPEWSDGTRPLVLYRRVGDSYCYVAFKSRELSDRLAKRGGKTVSMQVNLFKDFGTERGYNIRSVDGVLLASGEKMMRHAEQFSGQVLGPSGTSTESCWF
jgi:hypothetical protein